MYCSSHIEDLLFFYNLRFMSHAFLKINFCYFYIYRYTCNCSVDITLKKNKDIYIGDLLSAEHVQQKAMNRSYLLKVLQTYLACQSTNEGKLGKEIEAPSTIQISIS